jgi:hypothetical protein
MVLLRSNLMLRTRSEPTFQNAFGTLSKTRSEHLPERVRNTFLNVFGTRSWMRSETRVISLWSFESLRKIPNTINYNAVNPNSSSLALSEWIFESLRKTPNTINDNTVNPNSSSLALSDQFSKLHRWHRHQGRRKVDKWGGGRYSYIHVHRL